MIKIEHLKKQFGTFTAVDDLNLTVKTGEFFGLLGPNGAGKTTTISMLSTVLLPTAGTIRIDGEKLTRRASAQKRKIAVITQEYSLRQDMTIDEIMMYQGMLYYMPRREIREKTAELLAFTDLDRFRRRTVRHLSGGMKRKLMLCRALMIDPEILLLDEPTAGMDALARRQMWNLLRQLNGRNLTIILTTHYMEEAETLCDRIALMEKGKLDIIDTPKHMIQNLGPYAVDQTTPDGLKSHYFPDKESAIAFLEQASDDTQPIFRRSNLEDVFVERVGRHLSGK